MKITKELLNKHSKGLCTEDERKAVEAWFEMDETSETGLRMFTGKEVNKERIWSRVLQDLPLMRTQSGTYKIIPLYRSVVRYAAAVSILLITFFGGRFSASSAKATEIIEKSPKNMLYIYGGNGAEAYVPGQEYKIKFDGQVKLLNGSLMEKTINVGNQTFTLGSNGTYYLSGSTASPTLLSSEILPNHISEQTLKGDFSILRIDR